MAKQAPRCDNALYGPVRICSALHVLQSDAGVMVDHTSIIMHS